MEAKPQHQIREIERYFREELGTTQAFDNFLDALYKRLTMIADYPESGRPTGIKRFVIGKWISTGAFFTEQNLTASQCF